MINGRKLEANIIGNILFPLSNSTFNRKGILNAFRRMSENDHLDPEQLRKIQLERLKRVVSYANEYVPYYRDLFKDIEFHQNDLKSCNDLRNIPPLSRQDLIDHRLDLVDERCRSAAEKADSAKRSPGEPLPLARFRGRDSQLIQNRSSGSTGTPTVFYENGSVTASNWANELRLRKWFGINPGAREARMARVSAEYLRNSKSVALRRWLWNQLALPGVSLTEEDHACSARELIRFEPRVNLGLNLRFNRIRSIHKGSSRNGPEAQSCLADDLGRTSLRSRKSYSRRSISMQRHQYLRDQRTRPYGWTLRIRRFSCLPGERFSRRRESRF